VKRRVLQLIATGIAGLASLFVLTGSLYYFNNPKIPAELRRKDA
jgi:hypothetical protein